MSRYQIGDQVVTIGTAAFEQLVAVAWSTRQRPRCLCRDPGLEMYIARLGEGFIVKRMPESGRDHATDCGSYEPPAELSGLGEVLGSAIREDVEEGITDLRLAFTLRKIGGRAVPVPAAGDGDTVKTQNSKLTLRGTLHYLWDQAQFNRWMPAMAGKRHWWTLHKYLLAASDDKRTRASSLRDLLYIPEPYTHDGRDDIAQRRQALLAPMAHSGGGARSLRILLAEVKTFEPARFGFKATMKQVPDFPFMMNDDIYRAMERRFERELSLWAAIEGGHLIMIATFSVRNTGLASIEELALMNVTAQWLPFEDAYEKALIDRLVEERRSFIKGLRYNLRPARPLAAAVTADTGHKAHALYIVPPAATDEFRGEMDRLIAEAWSESWIWDVASGAMPPIPPREVR
jgi:hypothetical protein